VAVWRSVFNRETERAARTLLVTRMAQSQCNQLTAAFAFTMKLAM
jgi:hypothetical protein